jgi:hypothetical protein
MIALAAERTSFPETGVVHVSGGTLFRYLVGPMRATSRRSTAPRSSCTAGVTAWSRSASLALARRRRDGRSSSSTVAVTSPARATGPLREHRHRWPTGSRPDRLTGSRSARCWPAGPRRLGYGHRFAVDDDLVDPLVEEADQLGDVFWRVAAIDPASVETPPSSVLFYFSGYAVVSEEDVPSLLLDGERLSTLSLKRVRRLLGQSTTAFVVSASVSPRTTTRMRWFVFSVVIVWPLVMAPVSRGIRPGRSPA